MAQLQDLVMSATQPAEDELESHFDTLSSGLRNTLLGSVAAAPFALQQSSSHADFSDAMKSTKFDELDSVLAPERRNSLLQQILGTNAEIIHPKEKVGPHVTLTEPPIVKVNAADNAVDIVAHELGHASKKGRFARLLNSPKLRAAAMATSAAAPFGAFGFGYTDNPLIEAGLVAAPWLGAAPILAEERRATNQGTKAIEKLLDKVNLTSSQKKNVMAKAKLRLSKAYKTYLSAPIVSSATLGGALLSHHLLDEDPSLWDKVKGLFKG